MTMKEKMLAGKPYLACDPELAAEHQRALEQMYEFNHSHPSEVTKREGIIRNLFRKTGKKFVIHQPLTCDYGCNIEIGENFYCNYNLTVLDVCKVTIGDNVMIAPNVSLYAAGHPVH